MKRNFISRGFNHLPNKGLDAKNTTECCSYMCITNAINVFQSFKPTKKYGLSTPEVGGVRKSLVVERRPGKNRRLGASMVTDSYYKGGFLFFNSTKKRRIFAFLIPQKHKVFSFPFLFFFHL